MSSSNSVRGVEGLEEEVVSESEEEVKEGVDASSGVITEDGEGEAAIIGAGKGIVKMDEEFEDGRTKGLNEVRSTSTSVFADEGTKGAAET